MDHKNEDCSKSVNSFHSEAIFYPRLGSYLPGNVGLVSSYAFYKNSSVGIGPATRPKMIEIFEKVTAAELNSNFGGPAGGEALERASPPTEEVLHDS